jgi:hypothetical protein
MSNCPSFLAFLTGYSVENNLPRNLKIFRLIFIQFLIIGIFANSLLPQACLCGGACLHGLQGKERPSMSFLFHIRCLGNQCKSCNLEDMQTLRASNAAHSAAKIEILVTPSILLNLSGYQSDIDLIKIIFPRHNKSLKTQSLPVYLQNLSLLI